MVRERGGKRETDCGGLEMVAGPDSIIGVARVTEVDQYETTR